MTVTLQPEGLLVALDENEQKTLRDRLIAAHPLPTPDPPPDPPPPRGSVLMGMTCGPDWPSMLTKGASVIRPRIVRIEIDRTPTAAGRDAAIRACRASGAEPIILITNWNRTDLPSFCKSLVDQYRILYFEVGNEDTYSYKNASSVTTLMNKARTYALQIRALATALRGTSGRILAQADPCNWTWDRAALPNSVLKGGWGSAGSVWIDTMLRTVPELPTLIIGRTVHPYGPECIARLREADRQWLVASGGVAVPTSVTEWGITTDDGRLLSENYDFPRDCTYLRAAELMRQYVPQMLGAGLNIFTFYHIIDARPHGTSSDREHYFGFLLRNDAVPSIQGAPKRYVAETVAQLSA